MRPPDFIFFRDLVEEHSGIALSEEKLYLIEARLKPVLRSFQLNSIDELILQLRWKREQNMIDAVVQSMTTNETFFFRDGAPFEALQQQVLPHFQLRRESSRTLNIWSAACSSGQEAYSIAMIIREYFPRMNDWQINILATDLSEEVLEKGRQGAYNQFEIDRGLPKSLLKYFRQDGRLWKIDDKIRQMVEFRSGNLVEDVPSSYPRMDIIFLRNVLIYFKPEVKEQILTRIEKILKPDGVVFLGQSESISQLNVPLQTYHIGTVTCLTSNNNVQFARA